LGGGELTRVFCHDRQKYSLFDDLTKTKNIFNAWYLFRKGKRKRPGVQQFERFIEYNLFKLQDQLKSDSYKHDRYIPFTVHDPKQRSVHKATVKDRVVHQLVVSAIEPLFDKTFIYDSYSCRKGKGTHAAVQRLKTFLLKASCNNTKTAYALKCDISKFFASVDHEVLLKLLKKRVVDHKTIELLEEILSSFQTVPNKGIPLGNLTSQLFANVYMHQLDWFVKHTLGEKYYLRYCDDFIILSTDREHLFNIIPILMLFIEEELHLSIHPNKTEIRTWNQGIDFLGYVLKPNCTVLRSKTKNRMLDRVDKNNLSSYLGICSHGNCYELERLIVNKIQLDNDIITL